MSEIVLFPLTGDYGLVEGVKNYMESLECGSIKILHSAELVDKQVRCLRESICSWSAKTGNYQVRGRSIKEWFVLPCANVSTWWFSLLSEKNTLKTNLFFCIAQVNAIKETLKEDHYDICLISASNKQLLRSIKNITRNLGIKTRIISVLNLKATKEKLKYFLSKLELTGELLLAFYTFIVFFWRGIQARHWLGSSKKRMPEENSLLFVSYFPAISGEAASKGLFRNKYALALQDILEEEGIKIVWLLMYVFLDGHTFRDALALARKFSQNGERLFLVHEFVSLKIVFQCLAFWLKQIFISLFLYGSVKNDCLAQEPVSKECGPLLKSIWYKSFLGFIGLEGILYFLIYRKIFRTFVKISDCVYYCEMHAWEKALNAAKNQENRNIRTIGFQHTSVSNNHFHYFYDQSETIRTKKASDLPLPDVLACNGSFMCALLAKSGYPNISRVEAVRYLYLDEILLLPSEPRKENPLLLVAGSIDKTESANLISLVRVVFPRVDEFDIWFKSHPAMPFEELFKELEFDVFKTGYQIQHDDLRESLRLAWAVLVSSSTVAIEALAFGCEVIVPVFPSSMLMNPVSDFEGYYHRVTSPEDLMNTMKKIAAGNSLHGIDEYRQFIRKYWDIDQGLRKWKNLLL